MRILFVKLGSIGDIVHTLPALKAVRSALPDAEISWVVEERVAEILRGNELIDNLIEVDTRALRDFGRGVDEMIAGARAQIRGLRSFEFDVAIDLQGLWKSALVAKLSGAPRRWGFSREDLREPGSRVLLTDSVNAGRDASMNERVHVVRKNLALAAGALNIDVPDADFEFPIYTGDEHSQEADEIAASAVHEFAILNPGGGWVTKLWHAEKFGALADRLWNEMRLASIVLTGPGEDELAERVRAATHSGRTIFAKPSLKGLYELAKRARVFVGGDTGPTHIAVAAGAPVVGLFGPTEWWRNGSTNPADLVVERSDIACRIYCHRRTCSNWICMDSDVDAVFDAVVKRLEGTKVARSESG